ncbi:hypothetical protein A176_002925 [Myxococcus hansupus]|uniref:Uncharacterized protein n=1 Tax=Pseudomyxococcus hansupus TaxID=1297742 RepID=A0A0H4WWP5_9BACT|nr:hypothetical protein A176_002925 [Myxococcus hansupus]
MKPAAPVTSTRMCAPRSHALHPDATPEDLDAALPVPANCT